MAVIDGKWLSKEGLTYFWSKIKSIFTKQTETNVIANLGAKNLLKVASTTQTVNGVTFTVNDDQTITVNGTASATITYVVTPNEQAILIPDGTYVLSGCPSGGGATTFDLRWYLYSSGKSAYDRGSGASVAKDGNTTSSNVAIVIKSGVTANNLVFKPMIRRAEITDDTFQPYAPTNRELYETSQQSYDFIIGLGTELKSNDDLNNYNKVGKIYAATGAIAATISNTPWTLSGFIVITIPLLTTTTFMQFLLPNSMGGKWYRRRYTQGAWSAWIEYDGTQITASQSASSASLMQTGPIDVELSDAGDDEPEEEER